MISEQDPQPTNLQEKNPNQNQTIFFLIKNYWYLYTHKKSEILLIQIFSTKNKVEYKTDK